MPLCCGIKSTIYTYYVVSYFEEIKEVKKDCGNLFSCYLIIRKI